MYLKPFIGSGRLTLRVHYTHHKPETWARLVGINPTSGNIISLDIPGALPMLLFHSVITPWYCAGLVSDGDLWGEVNCQSLANYIRGILDCDTQPSHLLPADPTHVLTVADGTFLKDVMRRYVAFLGNPDDKGFAPVPI
jgi:hypothetical protein